MDNAVKFHLRKFSEQEHILVPGDYVHEFMFVCSGLLRFYYLAEDGSESNKAFAAENDFAGPLAASFLDLPVIYGNQTLCYNLGGNDIGGIMMITKFINEPVPLEIDDDKVIRVSGTRVTLDTVIYAFHEGASAEEIVYQYPTLNLADVYAVISYYLHQRGEVDQYLKERRILADEIQKQHEANYDVQGIRERLLARRAKDSL